MLKATLAPEKVCATEPVRKVRMLVRNENEKEPETKTEGMLREENEALRFEINTLRDRLTEMEDVLNQVVDILKTANLPMPISKNVEPMPKPKRGPNQSNKMVSISRNGTGDLCISKASRRLLKDWDKLHHVEFLETEFDKVFALHFTEDPTDKSVPLHTIGNGDAWHAWGITYIIEKMFGNIPADSRMHYNADILLGSDDTLIVWPNDIAFSIPQETIRVGNAVCTTPSASVPTITAMKDGRCRINSAARELLSNKDSCRYVELVRDPNMPGYVGLHFTDIQTANSVPLAVGKSAFGMLEFCDKRFTDAIRTNPKGNSTRFNVIVCPNCGTTIMLEAALPATSVA